MTNPIKAPDGKTYASTSELARAYKIDGYTLKNRLEQGMSLDDILSGKTLFTVKGPDGREYPTFGAMCKAYGIMEQTVRTRLRSGDDLETALTTETSTRHKRSQGVRDHLGNEFETFGDMCEHYGQSRNSIKKRLRDGMDLKSALETPSQKHRYTDHLGNEFPSLSAMCEHYGTKIQTVKSRMEKQGMSLEQALTGEGLATSCRDHLGNIYPSFRAMCRAYNVDDQTARQRMDAKWPLEMVLTASAARKHPTKAKPEKRPKPIDPYEDYLGRAFISHKAMRNYYMGCMYQESKHAALPVERICVRICNAAKNKALAINGHRCKITRTTAPYLKIEIGGEEYIMHLEKILELYHESKEFDPLIGLGNMANRISSIKPVKFPYYDAVIDGVSKRISYWDLMRGKIDGKEDGPCQTL